MTDDLIAAANREFVELSELLDRAIDHAYRDLVVGHTDLEATVRLVRRWIHEGARRTDLPENTLQFTMAGAIAVVRLARLRITDEHV